MSILRRCRECKHWSTDLRSNGMAKCQRVDFAGDAEGLSITACDGEAEMLTGPEFGCVMWSAIAPIPNPKTVAMDQALREVFPDDEIRWDERDVLWARVVRGERSWGIPIPFETFDSKTAEELAALVRESALKCREKIGAKP